MNIGSLDRMGNIKRKIIAIFIAKYTQSQLVAKRCLESLIIYRFAKIIMCAASSLQLYKSTEYDEKEFNFVYVGFSCSG